MIGWIIFGLLVGIVAKLLMPGRDPGGFIITILLGIGGACLEATSADFSVGTARTIRWASSWRSSEPWYSSSAIGFLPSRNEPDSSLARNPRDSRRERDTPAIRL